MEHLKYKCELKLEESINSNNVVSLLSIAETYRVLRLQMVVLAYIVKHFNEVKKTDAWKHVDQKTAMQIEKWKNKHWNY